MSHVSYTVKIMSNIIRVEHSKNYTCIANDAIRDKRLSLKARGLHHLLLSYPDNWRVSVEHLSEEASDKDKRTAVQEGLKELESLGYLTREKTRDDKGRMCGWEYVIRELPQAGFPTVEKSAHGKNRRRKKPSSENPATEKPNAEKPSSENQLLINTDLYEISKKEIPIPPNPQKGEPEEERDFDFSDNPRTPQTRGEVHNSSSESNHTHRACDNKTIDTQSSAARNEQLFDRKVLPVYRDSLSPNGIKAEFLEWLQCVHLPAIAYYKENGVSLAKAKTWVLNKEREQCQEILEDFYQDMIDSQKPKAVQQPTPEEQLTPDEETWKLIVQAVHRVNEVGLELNVSQDDGVWGLQTTFTSNNKGWNGKIKDLAKKFPLHTLPREFHGLGYNESSYRKLVAQHPHLHFPAPLPD